MVNITSQNAKSQSISHQKEKQKIDKIALIFKEYKTKITQRTKELAVRFH